MKFTEAQTPADKPAPTAVRPGNTYLIIQAALFYLEAAAIATALALLAFTLSFAGLAQFVKMLGIEQSGLSLNIVLFLLVGAATVATLIYVFVGYFRLLALPFAGRLVCALGALVWALPAAMIAPTLTKLVVPGYKVIGIWIVYLAVAAVLYWLKRRTVRM